eukprot:CAMPEP_0117522894 /NCGR_PEP_ID=MMETSP0784-20121206/34444_1 /TAXON_ID=39447 /ORGANISM="" /LENGTH=150 /DNA_ID=CAMNT_0005318983 /DNA_START=590 /DNA_END=1043 /DNA_ORIENTATION=-
MAEVVLPTCAVLVIVRQEDRQVWYLCPRAFNVLSHQIDGLLSAACAPEEKNAILRTLGSLRICSRGSAGARIARERRLKTQCGQLATLRGPEDEASMFEQSRMAEQADPAQLDITQTLMAARNADVSINTALRRKMCKHIPSRCDELRAS